MSLKKIIALALALVMCLSINTLALAADAAETEDPGSDSLSEEGTYRIAVMMPLSGNLSFFSGYFKPILDYAVAQKNANGGINGHEVELIYKDDQGDAAIEASALAEVLNEDVCAVIGPFMDTCGPVAAQWAEENHIPVFMCCALATDVGIEYQSDYVFTAGASAWAWAKIYADAVKKNGYTKAYYVAGVGGVPDDVYNFFWQEIEDQGLDVENVGEVRLSGSETDLTSVITSIMASGADVIFSSVTAGSAVNLLQQGNQMGLFDSVPLYGVYINDSDHTESVGDAYPVGDVYSITWFPITFPEAEDFAQEVYSMSDGVIPCSASLTFYYAFDTVCAGLETLSYEEGHDADTLIDTMENITVDSVFGDVYYTTYSHQLIFPMFFANAQFSDAWNGLAMPDPNDYVEYGAEVFPTEEEWDSLK